MKRCTTLMLTILLTMILGACGPLSESPSATESPSILPQAEPVQPKNTTELPFETKPSEDDNAVTITITVGSSVFPAKLYDNDTTAAFLALLPMTLDMSELNGNEKYYYLPEGLPTDSQRVGSIHAGDLMLYGSDCLVLFYESFGTSYSYTRLGYIEDVSGLANVMGRGSVEVAFAVGD